jgi:quinoprotein glucose dehydrogenase
VNSVYFALTLLCVQAKACSSAAEEWPIYSGNNGGTKYSKLKQINRSNVAQLKPAWIYHCDDFRRQPASTIECNPIVIDGTIYLTSPGLKLLTLEPATGK